MTPDWRSLAACRDHSPEDWFPDLRADARAAQTICNGCAARIACARDALATGERYGVRAGVLIDDRHIERSRAKLREVAR